LHLISQGKLLNESEHASHGSLSFTKRKGRPGSCRGEKSGCSKNLCALGRQFGFAFGDTSQFSDADAKDKKSAPVAKIPYISRVYLRPKSLRLFGDSKTATDISQVSLLTAH
jgi:hypothetical protein